MDSKFRDLNKKDFLKGLLIAILVPLFVLIQTSIGEGELTFDWIVLGRAALGGGIAYLLKNFFSGENQTNKT